MYHAIVKRTAVRNFRLVNEGNFEPLLAACAPDIHHRFGGDHALGGERHDRDALRRWFQRLKAIAPGLVLTVTDVWVSGGLWDTRIFVRWTGAETLPDASEYRNHGVHVIRMRWGKITEIDANEDSQAVAASMPIRAAHGASEALAAPIVS